MLLPRLFSLLFAILLFSCSGHKNERELGSMPPAFTGHFKAIAGEKLHYRARMGFITLGELDLQVSENPDSASGRQAWIIRADGASASGFSWISTVEHHWESRIDTANGISLFTRRRARENRYRVHEEIKYLPDSNLIRVYNLKKGQNRLYSSSPANMQDLINLMWKLRYSDFDSHRAGDTLNYSGFHDGEWLAFRLCYAGKKHLGRGKNKKEVYELFPTGLATTFLRGENPARIWIETAAQRRPIRAKLESYFGNFQVDLVEK